MKRKGRRSAIGALVMVSALAIAAPGIAGTKTNTGKVKGDSNSKVVAKVKVKKGKPKMLTLLKFKRVDVQCQGSVQEFDAKYTDVKVTKRNGKYKFTVTASDRSSQATGTVKKHGKKVQGQIDIRTVFCRGGGSFAAKR